MTFNRLVQIFAVLLLAFGVLGSADAAKREQKEVKYPNATREEPKIKPASRLNRQMTKMYDLSDGEDTAKTIEAGTEILENKGAGNYERSMAAQIIGFAYADQDDYPNAISYLERALAENGLDNNAHYQIMYQIGQLYMAEENYEKALEVLNRFLAETRSEQPEHKAVLANIYFRLERFEEAADTLKGAVASVAEPDPNWLRMLMAAYFELDRADEAVKIAEQLRARNPNDATLLRDLVAINMQADNNEQAIKLLEEGKTSGLLSEERDYTQLYQLYHYLEQEAQAIATIEEGIAKGILKPSLVLYRTIAEAHYFSDNMPKAAEAYAKAAEYDTEGEMSLNLARVLIELERFDDAKAAANAAIAKGVKRRGDAYLIIGGVELEKDNRAGAIAAYKEAAKYPESKDSAQSWLKASGIR